MVLLPFLGSFFAILQHSLEEKVAPLTRAHGPLTLL
jgi:hypothetical protein